MKNITALLLCSVLSAAVPGVSAATVYTEGCFGSGNQGTVAPSIAGYPVSVIGTGAFSDCNTIRKIEEAAVSGSQTVVYHSNTGQETVREPKPIPAPKASAATRALSGSGGNADSARNRDGCMP